MSKNRNPFTPVFGKDPACFAGREQIIADMRFAFEASATDPNLSSFFVGARGTGKTALLSRLASEAGSAGWIVANVTSVPGMLDDVLQRIQEQGSHLLSPRKKRELTGVSINPLGSLSWEHTADDSLNWRSKMNMILDQFAASDTGILITVDEVNPSLDEMVQLATTYQHFVRENRKVGLLMAGLPHNISALLSGESTSFLRRAFRHDLGLISHADIEEAFRFMLDQAGRRIEDSALAAAVEATGGFPFMFQLVGYRMWNATGEGSCITEEAAHTGIRLAQADLQRQIFDSTLSELSKADMAFLRAMLPDDDDSTTVDIAMRLGKPSGHVSTYKKRLLEAGVIEERGRNAVRFCLPGFREYLNRTTGDVTPFMPS